MHNHKSGREGWSKAVSETFMELLDEIDRTSDDALPFFQKLGLAPQVDTSETDLEVRLRIALPDVEGDVRLSIKGPRLTIKAEKRAQSEEANEDRAVDFTVRLPFAPRDSDVTASFEDGVLTIVVKKNPLDPPNASQPISIGKGPQSGGAAASIGD